MSSLPESAADQGEILEIPKMIHAVHSASREPTVGPVVGGDDGGVVVDWADAGFRSSMVVVRMRSADVRADD